MVLLDSVSDRPSALSNQRDAKWMFVMEELLGLLKGCSDARRPLGASSISGQTFLYGVSVQSNKGTGAQTLQSQRLIFIYDLNTTGSKSCQKGCLDT